MALGFDFNEASPYLKRKEQAYGRPSGRPVGTTGTITGRVTEPGTPGTTGTATPTGSGIATEMGQSPYAGFLKGLTKPIQYEDRTQQRFNIARGGIQSGTRTALEQASTYMGGKGFRGGESGIADTALGKIATGGAERLSRASLEIGESEAARRSEYEALDLQRKISGAGISLSGEEGALNRMMEYYKAKLSAETAEFQPWWQGLASGYNT